MPARVDRANVEPTDERKVLIAGSTDVTMICARAIWPPVAGDVIGSAERIGWVVKRLGACPFGL